MKCRCTGKHSADFRSSVGQRRWQPVKLCMRRVAEVFFIRIQGVVADGSLYTLLREEHLQILHRKLGKPTVACYFKMDMGRNVLKLVLGIA